jgi:16S rRNA (adenine1518-N6/adenine1519-N6)-dimethyltransferase
MYSLTDKKTIDYLTKKYGFRLKKSLGQNFLNSDEVLADIAEAACDEGILEIGPGIGSLTAALAVNSKRVVTVETDRDLLPVLEETLAALNNIEVINADFMKIDVKALLEEKFEGMSVSVAANLPYYITTPIVMKLLESELSFNKIVIMVQKEVADRILALPGKKDYGALSLAVNFYCRPSVVTHVGKECFTPSPKVDSTVIKLEVLPKPKVFVCDKKLFFRLIKASFGQRRKTLANALKNSGAFGSREDIMAAFDEAGVGSMERGENLSIETFARLSNIFYKNRN